MLPALLALMLAQAPMPSASPVVRQSRTVMTAPLSTSGHTNPGPASCGYAYRFYVEADGGMVALPGAGWPALPVEQGAGPTVAATSFVPTPGGAPVYARSAVTDSNAAYVLAGHAADAGLAAVWTGNHTVMCHYFATGTGWRVPFEHGTYAASGLILDNSSGAYVWWGGVDAGVAGPNANVPPIDRWVTQSARRNGTSFTSRVNGTAASVVSTIDVGVPTAKNLYLGRSSASARQLGGAHAGCTIYPCALTDAELLRIENQWAGTIAESRNVPVDRNSTATMWNGTLLVKYGDDMGRVHPTYGLLSYAATSNLGVDTEALDSANYNSWAEAGAATPSTTGNYAVAPDLAVTAERFQWSASAGNSIRGPAPAYSVTSGASYTHSLWVRGTAGSGTVYLGDWNASNGNKCTKTACAYDSTTHVRCTHTYTADETNSNHKLWLGYINSRGCADTGGVLAADVSAWGAQTESGSVASPYVPCGAAPCASVADKPEVSTAGWPTTGGEITLDYTPWSATDATYMRLLWWVTSNNGVALRRNADNTVTMETGNGSVLGSVSSAAQTFTANTEYRFRIRWGGGHRWLYRATCTGSGATLACPAGTLIASTTNGTAEMPSGAAGGATAYLGVYPGGSQSANGWVRLVDPGVAR